MYKEEDFDLVTSIGIVLAKKKSLSFNLKR